MAQEQKKPDPFTEDDLPEITPDAAAETEEEASALPDESEVTDPEVLRAEIAELKDRLLRALAETENLRKRAERDRRDAEQYGITRFARDLLSVHDNFERAMNAVTGEMREVAGPLIEGIELTQKELLTVFGRHGINKVAPAKGDRFDPKLHQAMFEAPVPGTSAGDIIEVMSEGFTIGARLLRPAQVGVSAGGPAGATETPPAGSDGSAEGTS